MIIKFRLWLARVWRWYRQRELYVIADPRDNSVTLSRLLFEHMGGLRLADQEEARAFVFKLCNAVCSPASKWDGSIYAFTLNPPFKMATQLCDIQYNSKHRTIGFESLCPSVNRIFYDYGLLPDAPVKLSVQYTTLPKAPSYGVKYYYIILPPNAVNRS